MFWGSGLCWITPIDIYFYFWGTHLPGLSKQDLSGDTYIYHPSTQELEDGEGS